MSDGYALDARERIPGIDKECGAMIHEWSPLSDYGFLPIRPARMPDSKDGGKFGKRGFGIFQITRSHKDIPNTSLVKDSITKLRAYALEYPTHNIRMDSPLIFTLPEDRQVLSAALSTLPDNVTLTTCARPVDDSPLQVGDFVSSSDKDSCAYHWQGEVTKLPGDYPHLAFVSYQDRLDPREVDGFKLGFTQSEICCKIASLRKIA